MDWVIIALGVLALLFIIFMIGYGVYISNGSNGTIKIQSKDIPHGAKTLVLSCMDYRFINDTIKYLNQHREGNFDYFVLAGASLGYNESKEGDVKDWTKTFEEHVDIAIQSHGITEIIVVDHMDCAYYKMIYGDAVDTAEKEERKHDFNLHKFIRLMKKGKYSELEYKLLLAYMDDQGVIEYKEINDAV